MKYYDNNKLTRKSKLIILFCIEYLLTTIILFGVFSYAVNKINKNMKADNIVTISVYHTPPEPEPIPLKSIPEPCDELYIAEVVIEEEPVETTLLDTYIVQPGDCYWEISKSYYGDGRYYTEILEYNNMSTSDYIISGDTLLIPKVEINNSQELNVVNLSFNTTPISTEEYNESLSGTTIYGVDQPEEYKYGRRVNPTIDINIPDDSNMRNYIDEVNTSDYEYAGAFRVTGYTPGCEHCCGKTDGIGASGVTMIYGYSVAAPTIFPLGTTIYVEGYGYYVVEDRSGSNSNTIDICCPNHESCYMLTNKSINVYIVSNN